MTVVMHVLHLSYIPWSVFITPGLPKVFAKLLLFGQKPAVCESPTLNMRWQVAMRAKFLVFQFVFTHNICFSINTLKPIERCFPRLFMVCSGFVVHGKQLHHICSVLTAGVFTRCFIKCADENNMANLHAGLRWAEKASRCW